MTNKNLRDELVTYKAFYSLSRTDENVESDETVPISLGDAYTKLFGGLDGAEDFFGLIDNAGTTLQAYYLPEKDSYWFEVPRPDLRGSYGASLTFDEATDLMKSLPETFPTEGFDSFSFQSWL